MMSESIGPGITAYPFWIIKNLVMMKDKMNNFDKCINEAAKRANQTYIE